MTTSRQVKASAPIKDVAIITLNRPQKRNALSKELIRDFLYELNSASQNPTVRVIVITGSGSFFSAGADLSDIAALDEVAARSCRYLEDLCMGMRSVRKPLLAAVNGPALGGGFEIALMCDFIIASKNAHFALPEVKLGLIPGAGGTQRLTAAVGKFSAMKTILLGKPLTNEEALSSGLIYDVCESKELMDVTMEVAGALREIAQSAIELAKEAICRADDLSRDDNFERNLYYATFSTVEKCRAVDDFLRNKLVVDSGDADQTNSTAHAGVINEGKN